MSTSWICRIVTSIRSDAMQKPGENRTEQCKPEAGVNRMVYVY